MKLKTRMVRSAAKKLPKHIRENIQHPVLRLAWMHELGITLAAVAERQQL